MQKSVCTSHEKLNIEERNHLVESNMKLVGFAIRNLGHHYKDDEDELQEGYLALTEAAYRFDPNLGYEFSTYAVNYIMGKIKGYRSYEKHKIRPSRPLVDALSSAWKVLESNTDIPELNLSDEKCRDAMIRNDVDIVSLQHILNIKNSISLDEPIKDVEESTILDMIPSSDDITCHSELEDFVEYCLGKSFNAGSPKSGRNKAVVRCWLHLVVYNRYITQSRLSEIFGISRQQINNIIEKFRITFRSEYLGIM